MKKKLIEVALPLEAINKASAYKKTPGIGLQTRDICTFHGCAVVEDAVMRLWERVHFGGRNDRKQ